MKPLIIDNFAGGGGASTGLEAALGRPVDVAINHDEAAIAVHSANHPHTRHYCQSIFAVDPLDATGGAPVLLAWFSPDCKHHSKAKGGKPRDRNIRDMAWVVPHWIERLQRATPGGSGAPQVIMLENVEEFRQWGPLDADGMPIKERRGEEFDLWLRRIKRLGYKVQHRELRACDYGAPTSRKRLFLIARRDGQPIVWPKPTHGKPGSPDVVSGKLKPWRTAAECIDWAIPCPSIFDRARPLKDATCRRIAAGVMRYVVNAARPFIIPLTHQGGPARTNDIDQPFPTVTGAHRGELALTTPFFARTAHGERDRTGKKRGRGDHAIDTSFPTVTASQDSALISPALVGVGGRRGQSAPASLDAPHPTITAKADGAIAAASLIKLRNHSDGEDPTAPLGTVTSNGQHHGVAEAVMVPHIMTNRNAAKPHTAIDEPTHTVTAGGAHQNLVAATIATLGHGERRPGETPRAPSLADPLDTVMAGGGKHAAIAAFMAQHNTGMVGNAPDKPMSTITGRGTQQQLVETTLIDADALPPAMMARAVQVAAFLIKYYGNETAAHSVEAPLGTVTTLERFAVVTVTIDALTYVLVDIGMRMLVPRELANAQGFPRDYILDPVCWYVTDSGARKYGPLPKSHQIAKIGNSVCPAMSEALARANLPDACTGAESAAA